ncbi:MAG: STAS domain-containing protein, partial [Verrucomicrobiota bacterium]
ATNRNCVFDLSEVKFVDSTGIGLLIRLQKKARVTGQRIILLSPSPVMLSALKLMRLQEFFTIARDLLEAKRLSDAQETNTAVHLQQNYFPSKPAVFWRGEVTAANAESVWQTTQAHIATRANSKTPVQIDLSSLHFIDSTGVGIMVRAKKTANAQGVKLQFIGTQPTVKSVLRMSKMESYLLGAG